MTTFSGVKSFTDGLNTLTMKSRSSSRSNIYRISHLSPYLSLLMFSKQIIEVLDNAWLVLAHSCIKPLDPSKYTLPNIDT
jgi:hypothetical protein